MAGRVLNADIMMDHHGKSKGMGEVQFDDPNDAISAIGEGRSIIELGGVIKLIVPLQLCSMARCCTTDQ